MEGGGGRGPGCAARGDPAAGGGGGALRKGSDPDGRPGDRAGGCDRGAGGGGVAHHHRARSDEPVVRGPGGAGGRAGRPWLHSGRGPGPPGGRGCGGGGVWVGGWAPPARFSFRWNRPRGEEPVAGNSMLVEFTLTPEGAERTRLRVTESGHELRAWPDAEKQRYASEHRGGWGG